MSNFGGFSNFPFCLGGDPSEEEKTYQALERLVGEGASPPGDTFGDATIIGSWRMARATGLVAFGSTAEAALYQAFPDTVTDELTSYEQILNIFPAIGDSEERRRQEVTERWAGEVKSTFPAITLQLAAIDSRFVPVAPDPALQRHVQFGRMFDPIGTVAPTFAGGRLETQFPNYSDAFVMNVQFDIGAGSLPSAEMLRSRVKAEDVLNEALPAWCDYKIVNSSGFLLDISLLDLTGL